MFKFLFRTVCWSVFLGGWALAALSLHVVRTPDKLGLIPKQRLGITDTYVDARKWTLADLPNHAELVQRLIEADKADLFAYIADPNGGDVTSQLQSAIAGAPASDTHPANTIFGKFKGAFAPASSASSKAGYNFPAIPVDF